MNVGCLNDSACSEAAQDPAEEVLDKGLTWDLWGDHMIHKSATYELGDFGFPMPLFAHL